MQNADAGQHLNCILLEVCGLMQELAPSTDDSLEVLIERRKLLSELKLVADRAAFGLRATRDDQEMARDEVVASTQEIADRLEGSEVLRSAPHRGGLH